MQMNMFSLAKKNNPVLSYNPDYNKSNINQKAAQFMTCA